MINRGPRLSFSTSPTSATPPGFPFHSRWRGKDNFRSCLSLNSFSRRVSQLIGPDTQDLCACVSEQQLDFSQCCQGKAKVSARKYLWGKWHTCTEFSSKRSFRTSFPASWCATAVCPLQPPTPSPRACSRFGTGDLRPQTADKFWHRVGFSPDPP